MNKHAIMSGLPGGADMGRAAGVLAAMLDPTGRLNVNGMRPFIHTDGSVRIVANADGATIQVNTPASLQYDEWKDIDRNVIEVAKDRLVGVSDLISRGLTHPLGSIGQTISLWERSSDMTGADVSMAGESEGEEDRIQFDYKQVPVPIIHKDFRLNMRTLAASRIHGEALDTQQARIASRVVAEKSEDMLFAGNAIQVDGATIYGYTNHPERNGVDLVEQWDNPATTGQDIVEDVQAMLAAARADKMHGPFQLYIPLSYQGRLDDDYAPASGDTRTIRQRIMQLEGIAGISVADRLATHNVLLVQMSKETVDIAIAQDISTVQWETKGGMVQHFKVMAIWVPRLKSDYDGRMGVVHLYEIP